MDEVTVALKCRDKMYENDHALHALGIDVKVSEIGSAEAVMEVRPDMINGHDICHGGFIFTLADTAFAYACNSYDIVTVAAGANIDFLRPGLRGDRLTATARERYRGKRLGLYDIEVRNQDDQLLAIFSGRSHATQKSLLSKYDT